MVVVRRASAWPAAEARNLYLSTLLWEQKKAEERKAKLEQTKKDSKDLIDSFKSLFD